MERMTGGGDPNDLTSVLRGRNLQSFFLSKEFLL